MKDIRDNGQPGAIDELEKLEASLGEFSKLAEKDNSYALLSIGVKDHSADGNDDEISTYISVSGTLGLLYAGLFVELSHQLESGDLSLFSVLADVISDVAEAYDVELADWSESEQEDGEVIDVGTGENPPTPEVTFQPVKKTIH